MADLLQCKEQIRWILVEHDIQCGYVVSDYDAEALPDERAVLIPYIRNFVNYQTALHEIGHIFTLPKTTPDKYTLKYELEAWEWAYGNAFLWDQEMNDTMCMCLQGYFYDYRYKKPFIPRKYNTIMDVGFPLF